jgi:N,N'-diacetyllegionaminate synthase
VNKVLIIAEAGVNHNGDINLAKKLIDAAADAGVDYVKFQTFKTEKLVSRQAQKAVYQQQNMQDDTNNSQFDMLKKLELSEEDHHTLVAYCKQKNIRFLSTAFDEESIDLLEKLGIDLYKIPSGEITNLPYLQKIASLKKPVIISTGMATLDEIKEAVYALFEAGADRKRIVVLHCNTEYPTPFVDVNLNAMFSIRKELGVPVGYSDHTSGIEVPIAAVALGATVIEKHFTLDKNMEGPDHKASLEPHELKAMVTSIRNIELALGSELKVPTPSELKNKAIARKSIHLSNALKAGHILSTGDLEMKRPGDGISPMKMNTVIGKKLKSDLPAEHKLSADDFE